MREAVLGVQWDQTTGRVLDMKLFVDHDHNTGEVRGLLCNRCNVLLPAIEDEPWRRRAFDYLACNARSVTPG